MDARLETRRMSQAEADVHRDRHPSRVTPWSDGVLNK